ncbi:hypothetical protein [Mycolicibacterium diernhoferi]|nr:hypothetical protein [Mycolicibacterium diernhoferi]QYL21341.1 hypothetical protein K0O62_20260 [Mycolicibacterium diernhoferi]
MDKPMYWELAAFTSLLVQAKEKMQVTIDLHEDCYGSPTGRKIGSVDELELYYSEVGSKFWELVTRLQPWNGQIRRLFGDRDLYEDEPTSREVNTAAATVLDFYRGILILCREIRGVSAPDEYSAVLDDLASWVGMQIPSVDRFITGLVGLLAVLSLNSSGVPNNHELSLDIHVHDKCFEDIGRKIKHLRQPWRRWLGLGQSVKG